MHFVVAWLINFFFFETFWLKTIFCHTIGAVCYNLAQFIYQLMMYSNIMLTCGEYTRGLYISNNATAATAAAANMTGMTAWLC